MISFEPTGKPEAKRRPTVSALPRTARAVVSLLALLVGGFACDDTQPQPINRGVQAYPVPVSYTRQLVITPASVVVVVVAPDQLVAYNDKQLLQWRVALPPGESLVAPPAVTPDSTTFVLSAKNLRAVTASGEVRFVYKVPLKNKPVSGRRWSLAALANSSVVIADGASTLINVDHTGKLRWRYELPGGSQMTTGPKAARNGSVYLRTAAFVYCVDGEGRQRWRVPLRVF